MALAQRTDPLRNFKFTVNITATGALNTLASNLPRLGFAEMSGLSVQNEMIPYREGGMNTHPHKMVGQSDFPPVSFSRGVFAMEGTNYGDGGVWAWQNFIHSWNQGVPGGSRGLNDSSTGNTDYRCDVVVKVYDHPYTRTGVQYLNQDMASDAGSTKPGNVRLAFKLFNCWPGVFAMNGLNAGDNGILINQLTVHHEGFIIGFTPSQIQEITGQAPILA